MFQTLSAIVFLCAVFLFDFIYLFIYIFAALGLCCCVRAFSSCGKRRLLFIVVHGLLIAVASLVAGHGLQAHRLQQLEHVGSVVVVRRLQGAQASIVMVHGLSSCGAQAQFLCSMWDIPAPVIERMSPALAGRLLTTDPPGKSPKAIVNLRKSPSEKQIN